jgi:hypothetical protein
LDGVNRAKLLADLANKKTWRQRASSFWVPMQDSEKKDRRKGDTDGTPGSV